jgi:cysteine-S-conjugate beta-lyase
MSNCFDCIVDRRNTHSLKWTRYGRDVLPLWVADMDFPVPEPARRALRAAIDHGVFGYELLTKGLAESVTARMDKLYGWQVSPEAVLATPGIVAGFNAAARSVCGPGEGVMVQPPIYRPFLQVPQHTGTVGQLAPLRQVNQEHTLRYEIDWAVFESAINSNGARTAMFLLCHPHNPTGQIYSRAELERMAEVCLRNKTVLCSDEIHSELLLGGAKHLPLAAISPEIADRAITLVSPSKTFNLVGLFCGFAIIPNPELRARYRWVLEQRALHVNSLGFIAAEAAFSGECESWLEELRGYLSANRGYVVEFVRNQLGGIRVTVPDATYLAWLDCAELVRGGRIQGPPHQFFLEEAKVALNPGAEFGPGGEHFVRLNFGCPRATLTEALRRMKGAVGSMAPSASSAIATQPPWAKLG